MANYASNWEGRDRRRYGDLLAGGLEHFLFFHMLGLIFLRGA